MIDEPHESDAENWDTAANILAAMTAEKRSAPTDGRPLIFTTRDTFPDPPGTAMDAAIDAHKRATEPKAMSPLPRSLAELRIAAIKDSPDTNIITLKEDAHEYLFYLDHETFRYIPAIRTARITGGDVVCFPEIGRQGQPSRLARFAGQVPKAGDIWKQKTTGHYFLVDYRAAFKIGITLTNGERFQFEHIDGFPDFLFTSQSALVRTWEQEPLPGSDDEGWIDAGGPSREGTLAFLYNAVNNLEPWDTNQ